MGNKQTVTAGATSISRKSECPRLPDDDGLKGRKEKIPKYSCTSGCRLLAQTWAREWSEVLVRCETHPEEAFNYNKLWRRTPLHLALFSGRTLQPRVLVALLKANRHASILRDKIGFTPLHYACQFSAGHDCVMLLAATAIEVESYIDYSDLSLCMCYYCGPCAFRCICSDEGHYGRERREIVTRNSPSPLYLACKKYASLAILRLLIEASCIHQQQLRKQVLSTDFSLHTFCACTCDHEISSWIAPNTGGEPADWDHVYATTSQTPSPHHLKHRQSRFQPSEGEGQRSEPSETSSNATFCIANFEDPLSPLEALWENFHDKDELFQAILNQADLIHRLRQISTENSLEQLNDFENNPYHPFLEFWSKVLLLLHAARKQKPFFYYEVMHHAIYEDVPPSKFYLLHAVSALKRPIPQLVSFALQLFPEEALKRNDNGYIPLHLALMSHKMIHDTIIASKNTAIILSLVRACPLSARTPDPCKRLPIALAVENGIEWDWDEGLKEIVLAAPQGLTTRDTQSHLYPFMLAAVSMTNSLNTVYSLIRLHPEVISYKHN